MANLLNLPFLVEDSNVSFELAWLNHNYNFGWPVVMSWACFLFPSGKICLLVVNSCPQWCEGHDFLAGKNLDLKSCITKHYQLRRKCSVFA